MPQSKHTLFCFCFEEPRWLTCVPKLLSLPNISHEALINKLNIRTLARKFVYFQIRKNNTYQVVFIGAQRSFHSLSLNVLAGEHVGFKRGKALFLFYTVSFPFFTLFKRLVFDVATQGMALWNSFILRRDVYFPKTSLRFFFSILIRPRPTSTFWIVLWEFRVKLSQKLWVPHWAPVKFFCSSQVWLWWFLYNTLLKNNLNEVNA